VVPLAGTFAGPAGRGAYVVITPFQTATRLSGIDLKQGIENGHH